MTEDSFKEQYRKANQYRKLPFIERPYIGSPGAPAQAETNASNIWGHMNGGFLIAYEYSRWWKESEALRSTAIWATGAGSTRSGSPDLMPARFINFATVKDLGRQQVGQVMYTPMVNKDGKVAIEGLTLRLDENTYMFTQSGGQSWLRGPRQSGLRRDPRGRDAGLYVLRAAGPAFDRHPRGAHSAKLHGSCVSRAGASRGILKRGSHGLAAGRHGRSRLRIPDADRYRQGARTLARIRRVGADFGLRELGLKAQMVGHTETGIATVVRDFLPARMRGDNVRKFARLWMNAEELDAFGSDLMDHFCSPAELGWAHTIDLDHHNFHGRDALLREAEVGGPARTLVGLMWNSDDMAELYSALFQDAPSAPPPDLPYGQFRMFYLKVLIGDEQVGWASGVAYSPNIRRMISLARIAKEHATPGAELSVLWGGFSDEPTMQIRARVHALPFIRQYRKDDLTKVNAARASAAAPAG